ncbi:MAG TPA: putative glycoside hydrolase [Candidatus Paceibacterota bacterium]|nr:putative glycoside hydrolase [Candidatus Paceibacterota bacterium]
MWKAAKAVLIGALVICIFAVALAASFNLAPKYFRVSYQRTADEVVSAAQTAIQKIAVAEEKKKVISRIPTPEAVKAIYITNWVAGTKHLRDPLIKLVEDTEINAVVIDIKDYTGKIGFIPNDPDLLATGAGEARIADIDALIQELHNKGIYVIGRLSVFQDSYMVKAEPEWAVKKSSDTSAVWKDYKGVSWLDAGDERVWNYATKIALESWNRGFDEINLDYIRFPSDGNMKDIYFPASEGKIKQDVLESFLKHISGELKKENIPISVDLFGMVTTNTDDLGIGQVLEKALPYVDYVAPMVYPSHYPATWNGLANPAEHPYEVIKISMSRAMERAVAMGISTDKLRPWLQDFDLGADYTADMVRAQIKATNDIGLDSWMIWNASNKYTNGAYLPESTQ